MFRKKVIYNETIQPIDKKSDTFKEYCEMILEVLVIVFFINTFLLQSEAIPSGSMIDTMLIGDHLLVDKVAYSPHLGKWDRAIFPRVDIQRGMIVTFKGPMELEKDLVKRVIGLPGDTLRIRDKKVYINGKAIEEPYTWYEDKKISTPKDNFPLTNVRVMDYPRASTYLPFLVQDEFGFVDDKKTRELCLRYNDCVQWDNTINDRVFKIPADYYFCMGDNRDRSYDSRFWGPVHKDYIMGRPWRIYWSYESSSEEYLTPGITQKIKNIFSTVIHFFTRTRWKRTFMRYE